MESFDNFEQRLRDLLQHLYDPIYRPPEALRAVLGCSREQGVQAVRDTILQAVEEMKPPERVPPSARAWRIYYMLRYRYIENLAQEKAAEQLGITARHLRRELTEAIQALALHLWEKHEALSGTAANQPPAEARSEPTSDTEWQAQLRKEIDALEEMASVTGADVAEALETVRRLGAYLTIRREIALRLVPAPAGILAAIHPSALRQILITVVDRLARGMESGEIKLWAEQKEGEVHIYVEASPARAVQTGEFDHLREFLTSGEGSLTVSMQGEMLILHLTLLSVDRCVLVVDDNADIVHLYRRYVAGTRYYIQHVNQGLQTFNAIETFHPDLVILDVMLPDIDGWDLLTRLHENPATRALPVVISTVMHEEELAMALGARQYITKPVQRGDFLAALDQAMCPD